MVDIQGKDTPSEARVSICIFSPVKKPVRPDPRLEHMSFRLSSANKTKLMEIAIEEGRPLSNLLARIVESYLREREKPKTS
jgi:hypothetical protein